MLNVILLIGALRKKKQQQQQQKTLMLHARRNLSLLNPVGGLVRQETSYESIMY